MRIKVLWYIQSADGPVPWEPHGACGSSFAQIRELAQAIDRTGFYGALLPTGSPEPLPLAAALAPITERMRFLVALHPGMLSPTKLVEIATTIDNFSGGRLLFNVVNGHDGWLPEFGLHLAHDERYQYSAEYWSAFRRKFADRRQGFSGEHIRLAPREVDIPLVFELEPAQQSIPLWGAGASPAGVEHAAGLADVYLGFADRPDVLGARFDQFRRRVAAAGRAVSFGTRLQVIVRDTEQAAWDHAQRLLDETSIETAVRLASWQLGPAGLDTELTTDDPLVHRRVDALRAGRLPDVADLVVAPNLWVGPSPFGFDVLSPGAGSWLVGTPEQIADRLREYAAFGTEAFILSGWPLLPEALRFARDVFPLLSDALDHDFPIPAFDQATYGGLGGDERPGATLDHARSAAIR